MGWEGPYGRYPKAFICKPHSPLTNHLLTTHSPKQKKPRAPCGARGLRWLVLSMNQAMHYLRARAAAGVKK